MEGFDQSKNYDTTGRIGDSARVSAGSTLGGGSSEIPSPGPMAAAPIKPPPVKDKVHVSYVFGVIAALLVVGGFAVGRYTESLKPQPVVAQCEGRLIGVGDPPPITLKDVDFSDFWKVWQTVKERHVSRPQSDLDLFYGAMKGLVGSLGDPYSVFFDPEFAKKFNDELAGTFEGIGAEIGIKNDQLTIIAPLPGSPAAAAGLQAKDNILAIDGKDTVGMDLDYAVSIIRGEKGSTVKLLVARQGWTEPKEISIVRDTIVVQSVKSEIIRKDGKKFGLITITHFNEDTESGFNQAVRTVLLDTPDGIIIDMRNNPGGFLDTAVKVIGEWVAHDVVLREKFSDKETKDYVSDGNARLDGLRTVVLVNGGSASASEIVAGALQDYSKAVIVGTQTYGKGSVQDYTEYGDGSALKLTVALWYTPKDRSIDKDGIEPDIEIENSPDDFNNDRDPQLDKAIAVLAAAAWPPPPEKLPKEKVSGANGAAADKDQPGAADQAPPAKEP